MWTKVLVLVVCLYSVNAIHTPDFYTGAVFEHVRHDDPSDRLTSVARNLDECDNAAQEASGMGADIIVFPEIGIMPTNDMTGSSMKEIYEFVPYPDTPATWIPCNEDPTNDYPSRNPVVTRLSCMAKNNNIYIAANIGEKESCSPREDPRCPQDIETLFYNTNLAFDSNGTLIAKHRKRFPFFEDNISRGESKPEYTTFNTSFGSFGMIICFDTVFHEAVHIVENYHVENMIVSTWWFDELPSFTSNEFYQGWATGNNVNVLVANIHKPTTGTIGSAIISGTHGALNYTFKPTRTASELLVARVPRTKDYIPVTEVLETNTVDSTLVGYHYMNANMTNYTVKPLELASGSLEACNNGLCCSLNYTAKSPPRNLFLVAFNGITNIKDYYFICFEICALVQCGENCTSFPTTSETVFDSVSLSGNITTRYQYPSVTASELRLVPRSQWDFSRGRVSFQSGQVDVPLLNVAIHGRCYDRDPPFPETNTYSDDVSSMWSL